ncbi:MAG: S24 family peptidase [Rhizobiaceae bacterium]
MSDLEAKYAHYRRRFREAMEARKLTNEVLGERTGAHSVTISKLRGGTLRLNDEWRDRIARALGIEADLLFGERPLPPPQPHEIHVSARQKKKKKAAPGANDNHVLPVFGLAAGSMSGIHSMSSDPVDEVPCPQSLVGVFGAYVLLTRGESMIPRYFPGDRLYINPTQAVRPGDHVVIQLERYSGAGTETWIKRFDGETETSILVSQYNPPAQMEFRKEFVRYVHRVLTSNELV